jgi:hypothetical protein
MTDEIQSKDAVRGPFLPILLLSLAVLAQLIFQVYQLHRERSALDALASNQQKPLEESQRMRTQLDGIAADTAKLAEQGNANAQKVIEELRKRGITVNPKTTDDQPDANE